MAEDLDDVFVRSVAEFGYCANLIFNVFRFETEEVEELPCKRLRSIS
jgi:hypothetical protein